jgi:hypothetical protein
MKINIYIVLICIATISGCLLEGAGPVNRNIKPYGAHWIKNGMTMKGHQIDSWACGAANTEYAADNVVFTAKQRKNVQFPTDKNDYEPDGRLLNQWQACMRGKGYTYLDPCDARCLYP